MNPKRLLLSAILLGLFVWGLTEFFRWVLLNVLGQENLVRVAPLLSGATFGILISVVRQKREKMLGVPEK